MYTIQDKRTRRFLSWGSMPDANKKADSYLYITHTGKIGTDFFKTQEAVFAVFDMLQKRNKECQFEKSLCIVEVNIEELSIGERFIERINAICIGEDEIILNIAY